MVNDIPKRLKQFIVPGRITILEGNGDMPKAEIQTEWSSAEVYMQGAHVTEFRLKDQPSILFLSQCSRFAEGQPIRGGIPLVFPWFGPREGMPAHGFARLAEWDLHEATTVPEGGVSLRFALPETSMRATYPAFMANYVVTITDKLTLELIITNASAQEAFLFESCLHSYFTVSSIDAVTVTGLKGSQYQDQVDGFAQKTETEEAIRIGSEVDRVYQSTNTVDIIDSGFNRRIRIEKTGSNSTVLWNPWIKKSQQMPDFGNDEYKQMVCVESGNVGVNQISLAPGQSSVMKVVISSLPI